MDKLVSVIVPTSGRGWKRKHGRFRILFCNPVYAFSQGKINLKNNLKSFF